MKPETLEILDQAAIARYVERSQGALIPMVDERDAYVVDGRIRLALRELADDLDRQAIRVELAGTEVLP